MRILLVIATLVLLVLVLAEGRPGRPSRGRGGRRPAPGNAGFGGRRPRPGGRRPGPGGRRPGGRRPRPPPAFNIAKWRRQVPFNETFNLNAKESAKYNQTKGLIFFTSSHRGVLRRTDFSQANSILDFQTEKMAIKTFTSDGLACFITDTIDTLSNTIEIIQSNGNSTVPVALGDNYVRLADVYTGDLSTDAGQRISNFCSPKICRDSITVYQLTTSIIVNIEIPCLEGQFRCDDGSCVFGAECDGVQQCTDGSDESRCETSSSSSTDSTTTESTTTTTEATTTTSESTTTTTVEPTTTSTESTTTSISESTTTGTTTTTGSPGIDPEVIKVTSVYGYFTITIRN